MTRGKTRVSLIHKYAKLVAQEGVMEKRSRRHPNKRGGARIGRAESPPRELYFSLAVQTAAKNFSSANVGSK